MSLDPRAFWRFSLGFYALPDISALCIACQEEAGADVNLLLFALWCAAENRRLTRADMAKADDLVRDWREQVVVPTRATRRRVKSLGPAPLYERFKALELETERTQQELLCRMEVAAAAPAPAAETAGENLAAYASLLPRPLPAGAIPRFLAAFTAAAGGQSHVL